MAYDVLTTEYFNWMRSIVCSNSKYSSFRKLFDYLYDREFVYYIEMDENRAVDGKDLRYRFTYEKKYARDEIAKILENKPCSVLEMMIALAIRCEEHIMDDPEIGVRTGTWFWNMIDNLGLRHMTDSRFNKKEVEKIIDRLLNREYERDGEGGLFTVKNCRYDLRTVEIWYQMCWYLNQK